MPNDFHIEYPPTESAFNGMQVDLQWRADRITDLESCRDDLLDVVIPGLRAERDAALGAVQALTMQRNFYRKELGAIIRDLPNVRNYARGGEQLWVVVKRLTDHGSTYSVALCRDAGIDPGVEVKRAHTGRIDPRKHSVEVVPFDIAGYYAPPRATVEGET